MKLTRREFLTFITIGIAHLGCGIILGIQAPFYPAVASSKGVSPSIFGMVFGVFQLTVFLVSPLLGQYINVIGARFMLIAGLFTTGSTCIMFGFLEFMNDYTTFVSFSFLIRIVEALGNACYMTASFSIATQEFSHCISTMISILEIFYGTGLAIGPTIGGALYEVGGFVAPFAVLGSIIVLSGVMTVFLLPHTDTSELKCENSIWSLLVKPEILLSVFAVIAGCTNIGFIDATLEVHLRIFGLSPLYVGIFFFITGLFYSVSAPIWGFCIDKGFHHRYVVICGAILAIIAFTFLGPVPFIPLEPSIPMVVTSLVIQGIAFGSLNIASFTGGQIDAVKLGFPDDLSTFGLVSGLWTSGLAFGMFFGPTCGGALLDYFGFSNASMFLLAVNGLLLLTHLIFIMYGSQRETVGLSENLKLVEMSLKSKHDKMYLN